MFAVPEPALQAWRDRAAGKYEPRLFVLSAPSGAGKDTIIEQLRQRGLVFHQLVTCTTRPRRPNEVDGIDYHFISREAFEALRGRGELLEEAEYAGHLYGSPRQPVREALARGEDVLLKIDVQGGAIVRLKVPGTVLIFVAPPTLAELERRLRERGPADPADLQRRLGAVTRELGCIPGYDYLVVNHPGRLSEAVDQVEQIILAERQRVGVPPVRL